MKEHLTSSRNAPGVRYPSNSQTALPSNQATISNQQRGAAQVGRRSNPERQCNVSLPTSADSLPNRAAKRHRHSRRNNNNNNNTKHGRRESVPGNESRSNTASPASGFSDTNDVESDAEWDVGVGNLVIDLDADIERSSSDRSKVNNNNNNPTSQGQTQGQRGVEPEAVAKETSRSGADTRTPSRNREFVALLKSDTPPGGSSCDLSSTFPSLHRAFLEAGGSLKARTSSSSSLSKLANSSCASSSSSLTQNAANTANSGSNTLSGLGLLLQATKPQQPVATAAAAAVSTGSSITQQHTSQGQVQEAVKSSPPGETAGVSTHPDPNPTAMSSQNAGVTGSSSSKGGSAGAVAPGNKSEHSSSMDNRGLKMKIKRTKNSSSKHGAESKHEIVKDKGNAGHAQGNAEQASSNHAHVGNNVNSGGVAGQQEKSRHHHHSNSVDSNSSGKAEGGGGGKSGKSGRNSQKKNKDKNKGVNNASTQSQLPDLLANGNSSSSSGGGAGAFGNGAPNMNNSNADSKGALQSQNTSGGGPAGSNSAGSANSNMGAMTTPVSVELDRLTMAGAGGVKKEPSMAHDPYEFNAKVEDRALGLPAMKKIKVEKVGRALLPNTRTSVNRPIRSWLVWFPGQNDGISSFTSSRSRNRYTQHVACRCNSPCSGRVHISENNTH